MQASFELKEEVKRVSEAVKFANSRLYELEKLNTAMFTALTKLVDFTASNQEAAKVLRREAQATSLKRDVVNREHNYARSMHLMAVKTCSKQF